MFYRGDIKVHKKWIQVKKDTLKTRKKYEGRQATYIFCVPIKRSAHFFFLKSNNQDGDMNKKCFI